MSLTEWAERYGVSAEALANLPRYLSPETAPPSNSVSTEAEVSQQIVFQAYRRGWQLWRNNVGAAQDATGRWVRYGLCNVSQAQNRRIKSADLIGIRPVLITSDLLGSTIGQFVALEVKRGDWRPGVDAAREKAQAAFLALVQKHGGYARFSQGDL